MSTLDEEIRHRLATADLHGLFLDVLGWDQPGIGLLTVELDETAYTVRPIAQKRGLHVLNIATQPDVPTADLQHRLDAEIAHSVPERLLLFTGASRQVWRWPQPRKSGGVRLIPHEVTASHPSPAIIQRLAGVRFTFAEEAAITLPVVKDRVRAQFNAERVTNRFYERFQQQHTSLQDELRGIESPVERRWYTSVLMNRLMFIYFLQKKGFLDGDRDYLRGCLRRIREMRGPDEFYAFYREILLPMFHHGFGSFAHEYADPEIAEMLGDIPYVNGGIFEEHEIESAYEIEVPDSEFERIFSFFDEFRWHLDDREQGDPNAINPDVIGYIFERYINLTTGGQREGGAYYTKEDVTGYMASTTVLPRILDGLIASCGVNPFIHLQANVRRYLPEAMLHGAERVGGWKPLPAKVTELENYPQRWVQLDDVEHDAELQLGDETWIETIDRRGHTDGLLALVADGQVNTIAELITHNLDIRTLVADVIHGLDSPADIAVAWNDVTAITIIDPTCGSGAFLFVALDLLDEVYAAMLERARTHLASGSPEAIAHLERLVLKADAHPNDAYYRRKHAALSNLFGLDIMREAIETAKLRLFLALVSKLENRGEIEPLPDLDFNLRAGNLLVGFRDIADAHGRVGVSTFDAMAAVDQFVPVAQQVAECRQRFLDAQRGDDPAAVIKIKRELAHLLNNARDNADHAYAAGAGIDTSSLDYNAWWLRNLPFHWLLEFPAIMDTGGFDVVLGNPPYINRSRIEYSIDGYATGALPDVYAPCVERALSLLGPRGRFAMILPISFQFSGGHRACREVVLREPSCWISTYSRNPAALFTSGLGVRSSIVVTAKSSEGTFTTAQRRWRREARGDLFQTTRYARIDELSSSDAWLPRTGDDEVAGLLLELRRSGETLGTSVRRRGDHTIGFKAFALYYVAAYREVPPVFDASLHPVEPPADKVLAFDTEEDALLAFALLAGDLGLLWWMSTGDDFNVSTGTFKALPIALDRIRSADVIAAAQELSDSVHRPENLLFTPYAKLMTGSWDLRRVREQSHAFDRVVLAALGLEQYLPAVLRAVARFSKSTGERPGVERGLGWLAARREALAN
ncbi:MAG: Eco57I restriction-modification methylase domain-containing protein [Solirubrobacteraceae bacterium]